MLTPNRSLGGSTPQFNQGGRTPRQKPLYHSQAENALILETYIKPGFGAIEAGTLLASVGVESVPYAPVLPVAGDDSRAFIAANVTAAKEIVLPLIYEGRFAVGDVLIGCDNDPAYTDLGAVTAINLDYSPGMFSVTVTNNATLTVAKLGNIYHKTATSSPFTAATAICDQSVSAGEYDSAGNLSPQGAQTSIVVSNAVLYTNALVGADTAAKTALGITERGPYSILK